MSASLQRACTQQHAAKRRPPLTPASPANPRTQGAVLSDAGSAASTCQIEKADHQRLMATVLLHLLASCVSLANVRKHIALIQPRCLHAHVTKQHVHYAITSPMRLVEAASPPQAAHCSGLPAPGRVLLGRAPHTYSPATPATHTHRHCQVIYKPPPPPEEFADIMPKSLLGVLDNITALPATDGMGSVSKVRKA